MEHPLRMEEKARNDGGGGEGGAGGSSQPDDEGDKNEVTTSHATSNDISEMMLIPRLPILDEVRRETRLFSCSPISLCSRAKSPLPGAACVLCLFETSRKLGRSV